MLSSKEFFRTSLCRFFCIAVISSVVPASLAQSSQFRIYKGSDQVGKINVNRTTIGERVLYEMESFSEFSIIWKQVVHTSVRTEYRGNNVTACNSFIKVNDSIRDSSNMYLSNGADHCYVHPRQLQHCAASGEWTTARMYYEEPLNATMVFVESVLQDCPLKKNGDGSYTLTFPNDTKNHYLYLNGQLREIQVIRPFFDLVFKKVA